MPYYPLELIWEDYLSLSDSEFPVRFRYSAVDISRPKYINGDANLAVRRSPVLHISYSSSRHYSIFIVCSSMLRTIDGGSSRVISDHVIEYTAAGFCSAPKCHGLLICFLRLPITSLHLYFQPRLLLEVSLAVASHILRTLKLVLRRGHSHTRKPILNLAPSKYSLVSDELLTDISLRSSPISSHSHCHLSNTNFIQSRICHKQILLCAGE